MIEQGGQDSGDSSDCSSELASQGRLAPEQKRRRSLELTESEPGT
jgi:hypothetical protein